MTYAAFTDTELMLLLREKDNRAFSEIFNRNWGHLYVHALKLLKDEDEAKDIVQDVLASLWDKSAEYQIQSNLTAYLFSSVRYKVLNAIRAKNIRTNYADHIARFAEQHQNEILDQIQEKELLAAIDGMINSLPEKMKHVFELSRKEHLTHKEIAEQLNISEKTVKRQISNALKILRNQIDKPETLLAFLYLSHFKKL